MHWDDGDPTLFELKEPHGFPLKCISCVTVVRALEFLGLDWFSWQLLTTDGWIEPLCILVLFTPFIMHG